MLTWTPKVCNIIAFIAVFMCLKLLFYVLLGGLGRVSGLRVQD